MRRSFLTVAIASVSLLAFTGVAQAGDPAPDSTVPPAFAPPVASPVIDVASAESFAAIYVARNAGRFLDQDRRRVRTLDVQTRCLQSPITATRFGCVFTLRAAVILRRARGWDGWDKAVAASRRGGDNRRFRIRNYGCLGALTINGGPTVTPSASVRFLECARVPRGDYVAPEPTT